MQTTLNDKNDIKIFILYLMRNIGYPLDYASINDIVVQDGFVNPFDFVDCFAELLETGNIRETRENDGPVYAVTPQGIRVAETLESELVNVIREKSLKSALRLLSFSRRGAQTGYRIEALGKNFFRFSCEVTDHGDPLMGASIVVEGRETVDRMKQNFSEHPETVYRGILAILNGDVNFLMD